MSAPKTIPKALRLAELIRIARVDRELDLRDAMDQLDASEAEAVELINELVRCEILRYAPNWRYQGLGHNRKMLHRVGTKVNDSNEGKDFLIGAQELAALRELNERLGEMERRLKSEAQAIADHCDERMSKSNDWWFTYDMDLYVDCWLKQDDPEYREHGDNVLVRLEEPLSNLYRAVIGEEYFGIDDSLNHNEFKHMKDNPMAGDVHCWLFHCLYDHWELGWDDLLRIGHIDADIAIRFTHSTR